MSEYFDLEGFKSDLSKTLEESKRAFLGKYKDQLNELIGLSQKDIDNVTIGIKDLQKYDELIAVVKTASAKNISQSELKNEIIKLGDVAIIIANKIPSLAKVLTA